MASSNLICSNNSNKLKEKAFSFAITTQELALLRGIEQDYAAAVYLRCLTWDSEDDIGWFKSVVLQ